MLLNLLSFKYFEQNLRNGSIMKIIKKKIFKKKIIGTVWCAPSIPPSRLQSVITWISQHIGDQDLVLLKQLWSGVLPKGQHSWNIKGLLTAVHSFV